MVAAIQAPASAQVQTKSAEAARAQVQALIEKYAGHGRPDYTGLESALSKAGTTNFRISNPDLASTPQTATEMQRLWDQSNPEHSNGAAGTVTPMSVPTDAFKVIGYSGHGDWADPLGVDYYITTWGFRDTYVNGSAPDDVVAFAVESYDRNCYGSMAIDDYNTWVATQGQRYPNLMLLSDQTSTSVIYGIRDQTSGFVLYPQNGQIWAEVPWINHSNCTRDTRGSGWYEHNQDGGGSWSASVSFLGLSVTYSGGAPALLRKSTGLMEVQY